MERLSGPPAAPLLSRPPGAAAPAIAAAAFWAELNGRVAELEGATEEARQANIGVARAKRVLKELQAQVGGWVGGLCCLGGWCAGAPDSGAFKTTWTTLPAAVGPVWEDGCVLEAECKLPSTCLYPHPTHQCPSPVLPNKQGAAVEAAARLDEALLQPRCSSAALKSALAKAEAAAVAAAPGACQFAVGAEMLQPRIQVGGRLGRGRASRARFWDTPSGLLINAPTATKPPRRSWIGGNGWTAAF